MNIRLHVIKNNRVMVVYMAQKLMDAGDFNGAIEKYKEAVDSAENNSEKGE